jgi:hypothetical protein
MALYGNIKSTYFDDNDKYYQDMIDDFHTRTIDSTQRLWNEAYIDTLFEIGDQSAFDMVYTVPAHRKKYLSFNNIRPILNMPTGYQRQNRKSTIATPVENSDNEFTDQITKLMMWNARREGINNLLSDAFHGALVTGINYMYMWMDYRNDPISGDLRCNHLHYNEVMIDPYFKRLDLSDCNGIMRRSYHTKQTMKSMYPKLGDFIDDLTPTQSYDDRFQFMPEAYEFDKKNLYIYDQFYYREYRKQKLVIDQDTNEHYEWDGKRTDNLSKFLNDFPQLVYTEADIPTVKLVALINGKVVYQGKNELNLDSYPFVPVVGYFNPQAPYFEQRIQGMVRGLRDAQFLYNRRKVIELDFAESRVTNALIYKPTSLKDPEDIFKTGQGKSIALNNNASMDDIRELPVKDVPPGFFQLSEGMRSEMMKISGVTEELLGAADDEIAGVLSMMRQGRALTTLQILFDNLDYSQKLLGRLQADAIVKNFTPGKIKRIINEEPHQYFKSKTSVEYDIAIEESFNTTTQKQLQFAQMVQLKNIGVQIPDDALLEAATIQNKSKIIESIQAQQQQAQQVQQKQEQLEMLKLQAEIKMANAQAAADEGMSIERLSRVQENQQLAMERAAQAEENRADARLNNQKAVLELAKTLNELDTVQLENFRKFLDIAALYNNFTDQQHDRDIASNVEQRFMDQQLNQLQQQASQTNVEQ